MEALRNREGHRGSAITLEEALRRRKQSPNTASPKGGIIMRILASAILMLAGCGGGDSSTEPVEPIVDPIVDPFSGPLALSVVSGANQTDTVRATLATPITVELKTTDATPVPIPGVLVNFVVTTADCGAPFAGAAITGAAGRASERWILGTVAKACSMEVRAVDADGTPRVFATVGATVTPGAIVTFSTLRSGQHGAWLGGRIAVSGLVNFSDQFGNAVSDVPITLLGGLGIQRLGDSIWSDVERQDALGFSAGGFTRASGLNVAWLQDLRLSAWRVTFSCWDPEQPQASEPDSIAVTLTTDSVVLNVTPGPGVFNAAGHLFLTGTVDQRFPGTPGITTVALSHARFFTHLAGVMDWLGQEATSAEPIPSTYTGGDWCVREIIGQRASVFRSNSPATMTKVVQ